MFLPVPPYKSKRDSLESVMHHLPSGCYILRIKTDGRVCHSVKISVK